MAPPTTLRVPCGVVTRRAKALRPAGATATIVVRVRPERTPATVLPGRNLAPLTVIALVRAFLGVEFGDRLPPELDGSFVEQDGRRLHIRAVGGTAETGVLVLSTAPPQDAHGLTPRELEVLASAADGLTAGQIAARLRISERTVERHLQNSYRKLDVHGRAAAVARLFGTPHGALTEPAGPASR